MTRPPSPPPRLSGADLTVLLAILVSGFLLLAWTWDVVPSLPQLFEGVPKIVSLVGRMMPPNMEADFVARVLARLAETLQIAIVGTVIGLVLSVPVAWLSVRRLSPLPALSGAVRMLVALMRTVPDLIWALIFVAAVGLGPIAGALTIMVDTIGFAARFFTEAIEDAEPEPQRVLESHGAGRFSILVAAVLPNIAPSMANTALFSWEKAVRSSVVLGLVGAGGIGQELVAAFELFQYRNASTIILAIFGLVMAMELLTRYLRRLLS